MNNAAQHTHHAVTLWQCLTVPGMVAAMVIPGVVMRIRDIRKGR